MNLLACWKKYINTRILGANNPTARSSIQRRAHADNDEHKQTMADLLQCAPCTHFLVADVVDCHLFCFILKNPVLNIYNDKDCIYFVWIKHLNQCHLFRFIKKLIKPNISIILIFQNKCHYFVFIKQFQSI